MLFEQAFMALPEFLTGTPFQRYQFEGTLVTAFSMATLQELNSRNISNPVSFLRSEVEYPDAQGKRADLHINLEGLHVLSDALKLYGYYENNWLEAKYCRKSDSGGPAVPALTSTFLLLKDLIRLCSLVPDSRVLGETSSSGRYLLHAYQNNPYLFFTKNRNEHGRRVEREWITKVLSAGTQNMHISDLTKETSATFANTIGKKGGMITMEILLSNFVHAPRESNDDTFYIVLSRIDDFKISIGRRWFKRANGVVSESHNGFGLLLPRVVNHMLSD